MPDAVSEMVQFIHVMGVTANAEATSKHSGEIFLPLPMTLSAEERKWTEWAFSLAPSSDKPWHDIKKANRKAWLWVLIFAISCPYCGSLSPLNEKQRCYKSVSQY